MKYVILTHSKPKPWGHPTGDYVAEVQALPKEQREKMDADFEKLLGELQERGELLGGGALGDPCNIHALPADGPRAALEMLEPLLADKRMSRSHRLHDVRAPTLEALGEPAEALAAYRSASRLCTNVPGQRYLYSQITRLSKAIDVEGS